MWILCQWWIGVEPHCRNIRLESLTKSVIKTVRIIYDDHKSHKHPKKTNNLGKVPSSHHHSTDFEGKSFHSETENIIPTFLYP